MKNIQITSAAPPFDDPRHGAPAVRVLAYVGAMRLLKRQICGLDKKTWNDVLHVLRKAGVASLASAGSLSPESLQRVYDAIEESPMPKTEWTPIRDVLGDEVLRRLLEISKASLQRYASGERGTPAYVADRLHLIALIVSDLAGSYNEFGIRRWFDRPRVQLEGKSPAETLAKAPHGDVNAARRVRELAASAIGVGAT
jgi:hypothetical protein